MPNSNPASFIDEVPEYEARDGRMHIYMGDAELVMPIHIFREGMARASRVLDQWFESQRSAATIKAFRDH